MVVADKISASKKIGIVPRTTSTHIASRPKLMLSPSFKSTAASLEKDENVESKVEAAEVIIIKLMINKITLPKAFPTSTAAWPCIPIALA